MSDKRGIEIKDLTKVFGSRTAVDNISLFLLINSGAPKI